jgi:hypothetical protein
MAESSLAIYQRLKMDRHGQKPVWRYKRVEEKRGGKTGHLAGPFYIRPTRGDGAQPWITRKLLIKRRRSAIKRSAA